MCDSDKTTKDYFNKHLQLMETSLWNSNDFEIVENVQTFFDIINKGGNANEK